MQTQYHKKPNPYQLLLKSPKWQKKRLETLERHGWSCMRCQNKESELHVHHRRYIPGRAPWEYDNHDLDVLCSECHRAEHWLQSGIGVFVPWVTFGNEEAFEVFVLDEVCQRDSNAMDDTCRCRRINGEHIETDTSCGRLMLWEKKHDHYPLWFYADTFREIVKDSVNKIMEKHVVSQEDIQAVAAASRSANNRGAHHSEIA